MKPNKTIGAATPRSAIMGQLIASTVALGIVGLGAWSLLGQKAPYHPEVFDDEVTRNDGSGLTRISD